MTQELRINDRIRITPVRVIDHEGNQLGIVDTHGALVKARELGLDLVEVSPTSRPPVCRIMDYGKFKYAQKKKERKARASRHETELKEVRVRTPKISKHDLEIKINHARAFLMRGDRVQFTLRFRGREMAHVNLGQEIMIAIKAGLVGVGKVERDFKMEGKRATMVIAATAAPKPRQAPKPAAGGKAAAATPAPVLSPAEIERQARIELEANLAEMAEAAEAEAEGEDEENDEAEGTPEGAPEPAPETASESAAQSGADKA